MSDKWIVGPAVITKESLSLSKTLRLSRSDLNTRRGFQRALSWVYRVGLYEDGERQKIMRSIRPLELIRRWKIDDIDDDDRLDLEDAIEQIAEL